MNFRQRQLRKFYMAFNVAEPFEFLWYTDGNDNQVILRYYGNKSSVKVPQSIEDKTVTAIECTAFYGNTTLTGVNIGQNITKIY